MLYKQDLKPIIVIQKSGSHSKLVRCDRTMDGGRIALPSPYKRYLLIITYRPWWVEF